MIGLAAWQPGSLAAWQRVKPTPEVGYVRYDAAAQPD